MQKIKSNFVWFCSILLKFKNDEAGLIRNRFYYCRCVVVVSAKVIFCFKARVLKGFSRNAWVQCDIVI